jgi:hypothetical protein
MNTLFKSNRHFQLDAEHPPEVQAWTRPSTRQVAACSGPCNQKGGADCPTPDACLLSEVRPNWLARVLTWLIEERK